LSQSEYEWLLWRVQDVARALSVSRSWVYKQAQEGDLPSLRIGGLLRFDPDAVRTWALGSGPAQVPPAPSLSTINPVQVTPQPDESRSADRRVPEMTSNPDMRLPPQNHERTVSVREAAVLLGLCTATVYKMADQGRLPHTRVSNAIRIPRDVVIGLKNARLP
jgi:excisionase family DNA binding protein